MREIADQCPHIHKVPDFVGHPATDGYGNIFPKFSCLNCFSESLPAVLRVMSASDIVANLETSKLTEQSYKSLLSRLIDLYDGKLRSEEQRPAVKRVGSSNYRHNHTAKRQAQQQWVHSTLLRRKEEEASEAASAAGYAAGYAARMTA